MLGCYFDSSNSICDGGGFSLIIVHLVGDVQVNNSSPSGSCIIDLGGRSYCNGE